MRWRRPKRRNLVVEEFEAQVAALDRKYGDQEAWSASYMRKVEAECAAERKLKPQGRWSPPADDRARLTAHRDAAGVGLVILGNVDDIDYLPAHRVDDLRVRVHPAMRYRPLDGSPELFSQIPRPWLVEVLVAPGRAPYGGREVAPADWWPSEGLARAHARAVVEAMKVAASCR